MSSLSKTSCSVDLQRERLVRLSRAILDDQALAAHLIALLSQGTIKALSRTCKRWRSDAYDLAPDASRRLARLTSWPKQSVAQPICSRSQAESARSWRERLLESIRMECNDREHLQGSNSAASQDGETCGPAEWFRQGSVHDTRTTDDDLFSALQRGDLGDIQRLIVCSSCLTDTGLLRALEPHWASLVDLCISTCRQLQGVERSAGAHVTGAALKPLAEEPRPSLRALSVIDVVGPLPIASITRACTGLHTLMIRGNLSTSCVESISRCRNLKILRLFLRPQVVQDPFIRVFTLCRELRVVDIYRATDVSDQILGCLMLNTTCLEDFSGRHASFSRALTERMVEAFKTHFARARILLDNAATESLL